jgi:hypothetical protein
MPVINGLLSSEGALIDVLVGVSENQCALLQKYHFPVPARIPVRAQIDVSLLLVSGMQTTLLPSIHTIVSDDFSPQDEAQALIGRDVLDLCVFNYFGPHKAFSLAIP